MTPDSKWRAGQQISRVQDSIGLHSRYRLKSQTRLRSTGSRRWVCFRLCPSLCVMRTTAMLVLRPAVIRFVYKCGHALSQTTDGQTVWLTDITTKLHIASFAYIGAGVEAKTSYTCTSCKQSHTEHHWTVVTVSKKLICVCASPALKMTSFPTLHHITTLTTEQYCKCC